MILADVYACVCVNLALLSLLQDGLPLPSQCLPASSVLQQVDGEHVSYCEVKETGNDQENDRVK